MKKITYSQFMEILKTAPISQDIRFFKSDNDLIQIKRQYELFTLILVENLTLNNAAEFFLELRKEFCNLKGEVEIIDDQNGSTLSFNKILDLLPPLELKPHDLKDLFITEIKLSQVVSKEDIPQTDSEQFIQTTGVFPNYSFIGHKVDSITTSEQRSPDFKGHRIFTLYAEVQGIYLLNIETYHKKVKDNDSKYISKVIQFDSLYQLLSWDFMYQDFYLNKTITFVTREDTNALTELIVRNFLKGKRLLKIVALDNCSRLEANIHLSTGLYPSFSMKDRHEIFFDSDEFDDIFFDEIDANFEYRPKYVAVGENGSIVLNVQLEHSYLLNSWLESKSICFDTVEDFFKWSGMWRDDLLQQEIELLDPELLKQVKKEVLIELEADPQYRPKLKNLLF